tara:strand:+ start:976 stop:1530 length:555 start_codon:yes stop_codon:yes gene_type:complete
VSFSKGRGRYTGGVRFGSEDAPTEHSIIGDLNLTGNLDLEHFHYVSSSGRTGFGISGADITHRITLPNTSNVGGKIKANALVMYSSRRFKTDIKPIEEPLYIIQSLEGVRYAWKETGIQDIGFIAEEVGKVIPEVVDWEENGTDASSMDYSRLTSILVEAVKAQQKQIDMLTDEINLLKSKINL